MMEHIVVFLVDLGQNLVSIPLLTIKLETLPLSWAISNAPTRLTSTLTWEKWVVSNHI
jgi:hypothetical protein